MGAIDEDIDVLTNALSTFSISPEINELMEVLSLNLSASTSLDKDVKPLLKSLKSVIVNQGNEYLDYEALFKVLDAVVGLCPFEQVLDVFSVDDLVAAIGSSDKTLIETACKVITSASPRDIFAGTVLLDEMLKLYFEDSIDVGIVNILDKTFNILFTNQLNRRRILQNNLPLLQKYKNCEDTRTFCRFIDIAKQLAENVSFDEFNKDVFIIDTNVIKKVMDADILVFIYVTEYYISLVQVTIENPDKEWILRYIGPEFSLFGDAYAKQQDAFDIYHYARSYLLQLFSKISYVNEQVYITELESHCFPLTIDKPYTTELLSVLNPKFIAHAHLPLLKHLTLNVRDIRMFVNLIQSESCFTELKGQINSKTLSSFQYIEQMTLLLGLTETSYGIRHLTQNMPAVMSALLDGKNVTEQRCFELRLAVIENLLDATPQELSIWLIPVQSEYENIVSGHRQSAKFLVSDEYM